MEFSYIKDGEDLYASLYGYSEFQLKELQAVFADPETTDLVIGLQFKIVTDQDELDDLYEAATGPAAVRELDRILAEIDSEAIRSHGDAADTHSH